MIRPGLSVLPFLALALLLVVSLAEKLYNARAEERIAGLGLAAVFLGWHLLVRRQEQGRRQRTSEKPETKPVAADSCY